MELCPYCGNVMYDGMCSVCGDIDAEEVPDDEAY